MNKLGVPSMADINGRLAGSNGLKVISTFAGTGGSSTGYKAAGFKVLAAIEFVPEAVASYKANAPTTPVLDWDIRQVTPEQLMETAGVDKGELDLFDGSPPCSSFSFSGRRDEAWGEVKQYSGSIHQRTDDLFYEYIRMVDGLHPRVFVAENVPGIAYGEARGFFVDVFKRLQEAGPGYHVEARRLEASALGIPQKRNRMIFVGVRKDLGKAPAFPSPLGVPPVKVAHAIDDLPSPAPGTYQELAVGTRTRMAWEHADIFKEQGNLRQAYLKLWGKNARYNWFKINPGLPCPAITAKVPCLLRWDEPRTLSLDEVRRIQSFPDDFVTTGTFGQQWERMGRAVPPMLMRAVATAIARDIFER